MPTLSDVTERGGDPATPGQIADIFHRYSWASSHCRGRRVLEIACGTGQGLGLLARDATSVIGCDLEAANIEIARSSYGDRFALHVADAAHLPAPDASVDVVLICEALYYLPDVSAFLNECRRVLVPDGTLLITTNNPHVFDFLPSPLSHRYYSVTELAAVLAEHGFSSQISGYCLADALPLRQRLLRPVKTAAGRLGLLPKTMRGKALLRRLVFGKLPRMPRDLSTVALEYTPPQALANDRDDQRYRSLYVRADRTR